MLRHDVEARLPTEFGEFRVRAYSENGSAAPHLALIQGVVGGDGTPLVRIHSECITGEIFSSQRCDCGIQLEVALQMIALEGSGVLLYLRQEGRGIGLLNKLRAYNLQDDGLDTVDANLQLGFGADEREYGVAIAMLEDLGVRTVRLLTNNPKKIRGLEGYGLSVTAQLPIVHAPNPHNEAYLRAKRERLGHSLHHQGLALDEEMVHEEHVHDPDAGRG